MWLGFAAGLALLTWFIVFPAVFAAQTTLDDRLLTFDGSGWQNTQSPQICSQVSTNMHSTSTSGDSVDFTFSGSRVIVWGPVTGNSLPVVVTLDGVIQPLAIPQECTGGCGVVYASGELADTSHNVTVLFPQANGTSTLSICGITVPTYMPRFNQNPSPPTSAGVSMTSGATSPTMSLTSEPSPPSVPTTAFITTRGMIIAIIGSIAGIIAAMSLLLFVFITVRGRITRHAARSRDRENAGDRETRNQGPKQTFSFLSSVYSKEDKSNAEPSALIESGHSRIRASITVSITSTRSPISSHRASGLGRSQTQSSGMPSIHTERGRTRDLGLVPGSPTESDNVYVSSSQTEENPLVSHRSSKSMSRLSIPITLFSPRRRLSSTNQPPSISPISTTPRDSRTSDVSGSLSTPRVISIRILPRKKHPPLENKRESGSSAAVSRNSRTQRAPESPIRLSSII